MANYQEYTDKQLLKGIKKYDSRALEELYNRYSPVLHTLIQKITENDKAFTEKILVEVFVIVWRKIEKFDLEKGNVYTCLLLLARNKATDTIRRKRDTTGEVTPYSDEFEDNNIIPTLDPDIDYLELKTAQEVEGQIHNAYNKLTDAQKYVIDLAFYQGFTIDEISSKLNIPVETVRNKVMTALTNLRENLIKA